MRFLYLIIVIFSLLSCSDNNDQNATSNAQSTHSQIQENKQAELNNKKKFIESFYNELGSLNQKWENIEVMNASDNDYRIAINYKESASISGYAEIERDTKSVVRVALKTLVAEGKSPSKEWISVFVHARQPAGVGETGQPVTRTLGRASYDFNNDNINFERSN